MDLIINQSRPEKLDYINPNDYPSGVILLREKHFLLWTLERINEHFHDENPIFLEIGIKGALTSMMMAAACVEGESVDREFESPPDSASIEQGLEAIADEMGIGEDGSLGMLDDSDEAPAFGRADLFDDFGGSREWYVFYDQMKRVYPDREPTEIPPDHPIWSIFFDIDPVSAPSLVSIRDYNQGEDRYMAFFDDDGRMIALANHNQDIGDGWEWPENNFEDASTIAFQMGINFIMYALRCQLFSASSES